MASEEGTAQPAVRRATALPQVSGPAAANPALAPRTPAAGRAGAEPGASEPGPGAPTAEPGASAPEPAASTAGEPAAGEPTAGETARTGTTGRARTVGSTPVTPEPGPGAATAQPDGGTAAASGAGGAAEPPAVTTAAGDPPSPRPNKPLLAAAAIGGSLLIGVPLLFMGMSDDDTRTRPTAASVSSDVLPHDSGRSGSTPGSYVPASPSATPSPTTGPRKESTGPSPSTRAAADTGPAPASGTRKEAAEKPAKAAPSPTAAARRAAVRAGGALPTSARFSTVTGILIKNRMTGLCVDVPNYGKGKLNGSVEQFTCDGTSRDNQLWDLVVNQKGAGPGGADLFTVRNGKDNYCLDLPDYGAKPARTAVYEWHCNPGSGDNQMWYLDKRADGAFWIRNHKSAGLCLDVAGLGGSGGRGANLTVYGCSAQDDHLWSFA
ncbi:RICIN domain-containing protein [Streptomyces sp. NPDC002125]